MILSEFGMISEPSCWLTVVCDCCSGTSPKWRSLTEGIPERAARETPLGRYGRLLGQPHRFRVKV